MSLIDDAVMTRDIESYEYFEDIEESPIGIAAQYSLYHGGNAFYGSCGFIDGANEDDSDNISSIIDQIVGKCNYHGGDDMSDSSNTEIDAELLTSCSEVPELGYEDEIDEENIEINAQNINIYGSADTDSENENIPELEEIDIYGSMDVNDEFDEINIYDVEGSNDIDNIIDDDMNIDIYGSAETTIEKEEETHLNLPEEILPDDLATLERLNQTGNISGIYEDDTNVDESLIQKQLLKSPETEIRLDIVNQDLEQKKTEYEEQLEDEPNYDDYNPGEEPANFTETDEEKKLENDINDILEITNQTETQMNENT